MYGKEGPCKDTKVTSPVGPVSPTWLLALLSGVGCAPPTGPATRAEWSVLSRVSSSLAGVCDVVGSEIIASVGVGWKRAEGSYPDHSHVCVLKDKNLGTGRVLALAGVAHLPALMPPHGGDPGKPSYDGHEQPGRSGP